MAEGSSTKAEIVKLLEQASEADLEAVLTVLRPTLLPSPSVCTPQAIDVESLGRTDFNLLKIYETMGGLGTFMSVTHALSGYYAIRDTLRCEETVFTLFLQAIGSGYRQNPYHNALHAADVSQSVHIMLLKGDISRISVMSPLSTSALFLSAYIHDYAHPGVNNKYLVKSGHELALRYNDTSPLENYHLAQTFALMHKPHLAILDQLGSDDKASIRAQMIKNVLATDMEVHFKLIEDAKRLARDVSQLPNQAATQPILVHFADIANVMKTSEVMMQWGRWINEEFFVQGEMEKEQGLPPSFSFTRETASIVVNQKFFVEVLALPLFLPMAEVWPGLQELLDMIRENLRYLSILA
jgi:hypothetical protein